MRVLMVALAAFPVPGVVCGQDLAVPRAPDNTWTSSPREEMESFEARLEGAVSRVSIPHAGVLLGRSSSSRGYRLPGYGIVFVLTPRALPGERELFVVRRPHGHHGAEVRVERHVSRGGEPPRELERVEELERRVLVLQHTAEAQRRAAEQDMDRMVRDIRIRLEVHQSGEETEEAHDVTVAEAGDAPPPDAVWVAEDAGEAGPPPWRYWFEAEAGEEERSPDRIVEEVRDAVLDSLDSRGEAVAGLAPEEFVTVAIELVPGGFFASHQRPARTLILRVRQRDLSARARGALASEELRSRVEVIEY